MYKMKGKISKKGSKFIRHAKFVDLLRAIENNSDTFTSNDKEYKYKTL